MLNDDSILKLRKELVILLNSYKGSEVIKLKLPSSVVERILFDTLREGNTEESVKYKKIAIELHLLKKLDLTGICFDSVDIFEKDLSDIFGLVINPQASFRKNMYKVKAKGVTFDGSFDDVYIHHASFLGSIGVQINPQTVVNKDARCCEFESNQIIGSFVGTQYYGATIDGYPVREYDIDDSSNINSEFVDSYRILKSSFTGKQL